jgi:hypothetical protein
VWLQDAEIAAIAARLGLGTAEFIGRYTRRALGGVSLREEDGGRCVLFVPGSGCLAYADRPRQCRTWPFWAGNIATRSAWEREAAGCPGIGEGEVVEAEEIERLARPAAAPGPENTG